MCGSGIPCHNWWSIHPNSPITRRCSRRDMDRCCTSPCPWHYPGRAIHHWRIPRDIRPQTMYCRDSPCLVDLYCCQEMKRYEKGVLKHRQIQESHFLLRSFVRVPPLQLLLHGLQSSQSFHSQLMVHTSKLQSASWALEPRHGSPPKSFSTITSLNLLMEPPPHSLEQPVHADHGPHSQS